MTVNRAADAPPETDSSLIEDLPLPSPGLQFATTLLQNFTQTMFLALGPGATRDVDGGTVTALLWAGGWITMPQLQFQGGPAEARFAALAAGKEAVLYVVPAGGDEVLAYEPDADAQGPSGSVLAGRVYP